MSALKIVAKLSTKTVHGKVDVRKLPEDGSTQFLYRITGIVTGTKTGVSMIGSEASEWLAFRGSFKAVKPDGQEIRSAVLFLPRIAEDMVLAATGPDVSNVQIAFDIGAHYDEDVATKYQYDVTPLLAGGESDPLTLLDAQLAKTAPMQLAAPDAAPKKAKKTADATA